MFISPMLLHKTEQPFEDNDFITELKLDGIRLILSKFDNQIRLYTRHNNEVTRKFPELLQLDIPNGTILDGEIIVTDQQGKPDFEAMMERFQSKNSEHAIQYCVFDVIYHKGQKVTHLPLNERKELLDEIVEDTKLICKVRWMYGNSPAYFDLVKQQGLEGIVQKKANSQYQINKRSHDWLKVINYQYTDAVITGLRKDEFGLLLGIEENDRIKPAGIMEFVTPAARKQFYSQYQDLIVDENNKFIYLDPKIKCRVKFRNYTKNGLLRIPSFVEYIS
ncbi:RNA ligase family protein [Peribacillus butanolivorans]|uniref:ATP-dependent DNA ligase n=1 Tax=Peribacillus butanolivorans TaxID=421767 RepID=UPI002E209461|nr:RNA ligase family protein [Peribacillus butanolivorans]